ncbi:MAG TPA: hypothetical protein VLH77_02555, partial [Gammaproteobacteria bacterium]|nr:hypothetical protein [Gammaproteobacteria bacterium]
PRPPIPPVVIIAVNQSMIQVQNLQMIGTGTPGMSNNFTPFPNSENGDDIRNAMIRQIAGLPPIYGSSLFTTDLSTANGTEGTQTNNANSNAETSNINNPPADETDDSRKNKAKAKVTLKKQKLTTPEETLKQVLLHSLNEARNQY